MSRQSTHSDRRVLALVCMTQFMVLLDTTVVNVALPSIGEDFGVAGTGLQWIVNAYVLAFAGFLLLGGRAADLFGQRRMFLVGILLFAAASIAGGLAPGVAALILARGAQGIGGAILTPTTLMVLTTHFREPARRARAYAAWAGVVSVSNAAGAAIGGVLTDVLGWRSVLFINVPVAAVAITLARSLPSRRRAARMDVLGAVLVTAGLVILVYGIIGTDRNGWASWRTALMLTTGVLVLGAFLAQQAFLASAPLLHLRLFLHRTVTTANLTLAFLTAAMFPTVYFLSLFIQRVCAFAPSRTGLAFVPLSAMSIAGAQLGSRLATRVGVRRLVVTGPPIAVCGLLLLSTADAHTAYFPRLMVPAMMIGFGMSLAFTPVTLVGTIVPEGEAGLASGLIGVARQVGSSLGLAILATFAAARTRAVASGGLLTGPADALASGYTRAFAFAAVFAAAGWVAAFFLPAGHWPGRARTRARRTSP